MKSNAKKNTEIQQNSKLIILGKSQLEGEKPTILKAKFKFLKFMQFCQKVGRKFSGHLDGGLLEAADGGEELLDAESAGGSLEDVEERLKLDVAERPRGSWRQWPGLCGGLRCFAQC